MSFTQQINIGQHRYKLVEETAKDSENKLGSDSTEQK